MKECPRCHARYDDSMNFCTKDGCKLESVQAESKTDTTTAKGRRNPPVDHKKSLWSRVIIVIAVIAVFLAYWYFSQPVYTIYPEISKLEVEAEGGTFAVPITTDAPYNKWSVSCDSSWIDITKTKEGIVIKCDANDTKERTADIYLECDDRKNTYEILRITQAKATIFVINGHDFVDLGLPSGVKWATCNVGANSPEDYGSYFAWGEKSTKSNYDRDTYKFYDSENGKWESLGDISGNYSYDVARSEWGDRVRIPTKSEFKELKEKCEWQWTSHNGVNGMLITGPNGNSIFLPATGIRCRTSLDRAGERGYYWSSTPGEDSDLNAILLYCFGDGNNWDGWFDRYDGRSVRPVSN